MEFSKNKSIYIQIVDYFYTNILLGKWKANDKAPSVRQLAVELEVNPNTVMRAYTHMQDKNIIYNQRGIGFFVAPEGTSIIQEIVKAGFISEELPEMFNTMELLSMNFDEIKDIYHQWKENTNKLHHEKD